MSKIKIWYFEVELHVVTRNYVKIFTSEAKIE